MKRLPKEQLPKFIASYRPAGQVKLVRELSSKGLLPESSLDGGDGAREWHFDKDLVEEAGLERNDLDGWVRWDKGEYLLEPSYDKNTGIYRGFLS